MHNVGESYTRDEYIFTFPLGNIFQLSDENWLTFTEWKFKYGPIVGLNLGGKNTIVLNTHKAASDLLDKRASIYSDRPFSRMYHDICGRGKTVFNISSMDKRHGVYRKVLDRGINGRNNVRGDVSQGGSESGSGSYWGLLEEEVEVLVDRIMNDPEGYEKHFRQ